MTFEMTGENRTITVYNLRADTKEFIGKGDAMIPASTGLPANCTTVKPPETKKGFIPVFNDAKQRWQLVEDHRGESVYDTATGKQIYISEPGAYPTGTTTVAPEPSREFQKWDGQKWVADEAAEHNAQVSTAKATKASLMRQSAEAIAMLQDAVDLDMATGDEKKLLIEWKKCRVLLSRVDPENPTKIVWPEVPEHVA